MVGDVHIKGEVRFRGPEGAEQVKDRRAFAHHTLVNLRGKAKRSVCRLQGTNGK
jgi:hypothetical protein